MRNTGEDMTMRRDGNEERGQAMSVWLKKDGRKEKENTVKK